MTPAARIAAAIEILTDFEKTAEPMERRIDRWFRSHRFAGSKDRRAIREWAYSIVRNWGLAVHCVESSDARLVVAASLLLSGKCDLPSLPAVFGADRYAPPALDDHETSTLSKVADRATVAPRALRLGYPSWLEDELVSMFGSDLESEMRALQARAPVDLRVNTARTSRDDALDALASQGVQSHPTPISPIGLRCGAETTVTATTVYRDGLVDVQDEGSQIVALLSGASVGETVVDYCAGAGGKSLALSAMVGGAGRVIALDVSHDRIRPLAERARRARADNVTHGVLGSEAAGGLLTGLVARADRVLVDAPCSGTGTWRRSPDARWLLTPERLLDHRTSQAAILRDACGLVRTGGRLIYATCSILPSENQEQVDAFLRDEPEFRLVPANEVWLEAFGDRLPDQPPGRTCGASLTPHRTSTDGFFVAVLERTS